MQVVDIIPKDIVVLAEFSISEIYALLFCLQHCTIEYDINNEEYNEKVKYFKDIFFNKLVDLEKRMKHGD